jgi:hypothetical protein
MAYCLMILWLPSAVWAYVLSEDDYATLKNDISVVHRAEFQEALLAADYQSIANAYNQQHYTPFWVWRTALREQEVYEATSPDNTVWSWTTYKSQTAADKDAWGRMFGPGVVNPSLQQTRNGWSAIFGTQGASAGQITFLLALARRLGLRGEVLFVVPGSGDGSPGTPAVMTFEGKLTYSDVNYALTGSR